MTLNFDPNNPAKQKNRPVWATYLPGRRGAGFKQHSDRGKALNALGYGNGSGILYHWDESSNQWVEVARVESVPRNCERCGGTFNIPNSYTGGSYESRHSLWVGKPTLRYVTCLLYTSPSPRDGLLSRMPSSA